MAILVAIRSFPVREIVNIVVKQEIDARSVLGRQH